MTRTHRQRRTGWRRALRTAAGGAARLGALAFALGSGLPGLAAELDGDAGKRSAALAAPQSGQADQAGQAGQAGQADQKPAEPEPPAAAAADPAAGAGQPTFAAPPKAGAAEPATGAGQTTFAVPPKAGAAQSPFAVPPKAAAAAGGPPSDGPSGPMAIFQLPSGTQHIGRPQRPVTQFLTWQFSYGSESDITYRRDRDLDRFLRDNMLIAAPQINGYVLYRPNSHVEMMLEMVLEREIAVHEEKVVTLPSGERQAAERRRSSMAVDQLWVRYKPSGAYDVTIGRRNFEDDRHWLYDTSLDVGVVHFKKGDFNGEFSYGRKDAVNMDMLKAVKETRTDNYIAYLEYRGIEDTKLAAYAIKRDDRQGLEGKPVLIGVRAYGMPTERLSFWSELAVLRGKDEDNKRFSGRGVDIGATYRFPDVELKPALTLGYANGSGDGNPNDNKNNEFRQTGLHSNELRMAGVSKFKYYGEAMDPDLSNLRVLTFGLGFRPSTTVYVDLVYHRYRANEPTDEIRNWALTARMNQDPDRPPSRDVGTALDVIVGFRNLFGVRRLGLDVRAGLFFPGRAFRNDITTDPEDPKFRTADKGVSVLAKFWY
jgi:alginate production protein